MKKSSVELHMRTVASVSPASLAVIAGEDKLKTQTVSIQIFSRYPPAIPTN
jgi:hypothetical protein